MHELFRLNGPLPHPRTTKPGSCGVERKREREREREKKSVCVYMYVHMICKLYIHC